KERGKYAYIPATATGISARESVAFWRCRGHAGAPCWQKQQTGKRQMLTKADDFPVHQLPEPIATSGTDRNFYDRYFFNGYTPDGETLFAVALGVYPHTNLIGAAC